MTGITEKGRRGELLRSLAVALLLAGCGAPFTASAATELTDGGTGGFRQQGGEAGARHMATVAGSPAGGGATINVAGSTAGGGLATDAAGSTGGGGQAGTAGSGGAPSRDCLGDWEGSSCDVCTSAPAPAAGRSCAEVVDCYVAEGCRPETCSGKCDYPAPTSDEAVRVAHAVIACRCGVRP